MKLTKNCIFFGVLIFSFIANLLVYLNIQDYFFRAIFSFVYLTFVPGLLIMLILKIRSINIWEYLVYSVGLSLTFLMFGGLLFNWIFPLLGIGRPLSLDPISTGLNSLILIFFITAYLRNKEFSYEISIKLPTTLNILFLIIPIIFPILSILGAISLNNYSSNLPTLIMLGGVATYVSLITIFRSKLNSNIFPWAIFFLSVALLFMTSLRGWYITGHDVQQEYYVFQLTKANYQWNASLFQDSYNACLSLNILPTIYSSFLNINDIYIFKILFQIIFSFSVLSIWLIFERYSYKIIAFFSVFFFLSFPTFLNDMPMLNRQEISLFYFSLMLLVLFNKTINSGLKEFIFIIFGFGMVVSHYSTSYIAVALFSITYLMALFLKKKFIKQRFSIFDTNYYLTGTMVLIIAIFIFFWNTTLTQTSGGITRLISQTIQNMGKSFSQDLKSGDVLYSIFSWHKLDKNKLLSRYVQEEINNNEHIYSPDIFFSSDIYGKYPIGLVEESTQPLTNLGKTLTQKNIDVFSLNYAIRQGIAKIIQVLIFLGFVVILFKKSLYAKGFDSEYNVLVFVSILLLGFLVLLPILSIEYGTLRLFQQTLVILALPTIIGVLSMFVYLKENLKLYLTLAFLIVFFLSLSGFIPQVLGGFYPLLNLNNSGEYYDNYYTHKAEVASINWLTNISKKDDVIQASEPAYFKILALTGIFTSRSILPLSVKKDAYVYLDYKTTISNRNLIYYSGNSLTYKYPIEFLDENKNLIYNNKSSKIYK